MNKIDLIIDALELYTTKPQADHLGMYVLHNCCGQEIKHGHHEDCLGVKALAAARELRELKPVGYIDKKGKVFNDTTHPYLYTPIYALDEVTK
jgi:hypothetical protein